MTFNDHHPQIVSLLYNSVRDSSPKIGSIYCGLSWVYCGCRGGITMYSVRSRARAGARPGLADAWQGRMQDARCGVPDDSRQDKAANLDTALGLIDQAAEAGADLAVLPEYLDYLGTDAGARDAAEPVPGSFIERIAMQARARGLWVLAGSVPCADDGWALPQCQPADRPARPGRRALRQAASVRYRPDRAAQLPGIRDGRRGRAYRHRGDRRRPRRPVRSATTCASPSCTACTPWPARRSCWCPPPSPRIPAAPLGTALRARAVENQCFVIAAGQVGKSLPGKACLATA